MHLSQYIQRMSERTAAELHGMKFLQDFIAVPEIAQIAHQRAAELGAPQTSSSGGSFVRFLCDATAATNIIEIGTGTGSLLSWIVADQPRTMNIAAMDVDGVWQKVAKDIISPHIEAHVKIRFMTGRSEEILPRMAENAYDLIVANASAIRKDFEQAIKLLRPNGLVILTHCFNENKVLDPAQRDSQTVSLRSFLHVLKNDERLTSQMLELGDGTFIGRLLG